MLNKFSHNFCEFFFHFVFHTIKKHAQQHCLEFEKKKKYEIDFFLLNKKINFLNIHWKTTESMFRFGMKLNIVKGALKLCQPETSASSSSLFFYFIWDDVFYLRFYFIFFRQSTLWSCRWHRNLFLVKCLHMFVPKWITSW